jgi:anti-sigma regulatory factor (Ser/Thr protein kinase)
MNKQKIVINNSSAECKSLHEALNSFINKQNIPDDILHDLRLVTEETFINIVNYAYPPDETHNITIVLSHSYNCLDITFIDAGKAFNPLSDCVASIDTDDHCDGGMGIHLIKSLTDQQEYNRIEERNVFTVTKHYTNQN